MKILHLSTHDKIGGAARAAYRLHTTLRGLGHESIMLVAHQRSTEPSVLTYEPVPHGLMKRVEHRIVRRLAYYYRRLGLSPASPRTLDDYQTTRPSGYDEFSDDRAAFGEGLIEALPFCQVINLHWVANFVDYHSFFAAVPKRMPVVWRLSDMNPFTGGCHYDDGCGKYMCGCGACPQLGSHHPRDLSWEIWQRKQTIYRQVTPERLHLVAQSHWIAEKIKESKLLGRFPVTIIPNGVDTAVFAPRNRRFSREVLGVPHEAKVVLFVANSIVNRRKGFALLREALDELVHCQDLFLLSVGREHTEVGVNIPQLNLGYLDNDHLLSLVYSAADLFVIPSLQDNLPNTVLESIACGTPVVGFDVGGIPDMARPDVTGALVPAGDVRALRDAIICLLEDDAKRKAIAAECRRLAVDEYALVVQAQRYLGLYKSLLSPSEPCDIQH